MSQPTLETTVDEIATGIYRISTWIPDIAPPAGFAFNQFLIDAEQPLLYHTGPRQLFPLVTEAVGRVLPPERLGWVSFSHIESDEMGSLNEWLQLAPDARACFGQLGCMVSLDDMADRPPLALADGEALDLGGKRVRQIATPHVPHNWEAQVLYEETTGTLLAGDLFTHTGKRPALTSDDVLGPWMEAEAAFGFSSLSACAGSTVRRLADLEPTTMALMHGSSYDGDCRSTLEALADEYDRRALEAIEAGRPAGVGAGPAV